MDNIQALSDAEIQFEIDGRQVERKRLKSLIDNIDTDIIGLKEEVRRRKEKQRQNSL